MGDVTLGTARRVVLVDPAHHVLEGTGNCLRPGPCAGAQIHHQQVEQVVDPPILDGDGSVHIGFTERKRSIEEECRVEPLVVKAHGYALCAAGTENVGSTIGVDDR